MVNGERADLRANVSVVVSVLAVLVAAASLVVAWLSYRQASQLPAEIRFAAVSRNPASPPPAPYDARIVVVNTGDRAAVGCRVEVVYEVWGGELPDDQAVGSATARVERLEAGEEHTFDFSREIPLTFVDAVGTYVDCERGGNLYAAWGGAGFGGFD